MCGITGYFNRKGGNYVCDLKGATDSIAHRGPDDFGYFEDEFAGFGHRRLSIIDLSRNGRQPMFSNSQRYLIVYNGEVYNYQSIRSELIKAGYFFNSQTDTEVVINGFEHWGKDVLNQLNGIFGLAIWDKLDRKLLIGRDRMGVKPLYYSLTDEFFCFGSEIKSVLKLLGKTPSLDAQGFQEFLYYGNGLGKNTLFDGINQLLPGHWMELDQNRLSEGKFWSLEHLNSNELRHISENEAVSHVRFLLEKAVTKQLISDVPVGLFLSGGIDSSSILAFASKHYPGTLKTYSSGFDFSLRPSELPKAKLLAKKFDTDHREIYIKGKRLPDLMKKMIVNHDEPFSDAANIPLYLMTQKVGDECKVILQGDGGDEMFAGYRRYNLLRKTQNYKLLFKLLNLASKINPNSSLREKIRRFHAIFNEEEFSIKIAKLMTVDSHDQPHKTLSDFMQLKLMDQNPFQRYSEVSMGIQNADPVQQMLWVDSSILLPDTFLEKVDRSTMANGKEVRVPFLDNDLVDFALALPSSLKIKNGIKKYLLKKAVKDLLPKEILSQPKIGFSVPYQNWMRIPLKNFMMDTFHSQSIKKKNIFDYRILDQRIQEHLSHKFDWGFHLWKMLNFCIWVDEYEVNI